MQNIEIIVVCGISASGKTTLGKLLAQKLNWDFIDLDQFYLPDKPKTKLSNGVEVSNWDDLKALNIEEFKNTILKCKKVVIAGFALIDKILPIKPKLCILLKTGVGKEEVIKRCIENRSKSKNFSPEQQNKDILMVKEIVYPYFNDYISQTTLTHILSVYHGEKRKSIEDLLTEIIRLI